MAAHSLASGIYAILLLVVCMVLAAALGREIVIRFFPAPFTNTEQLLFGCGLGLGAIAYAIFGLGLAGFLRIESIVLTIAFLALISRKSLAFISMQLLALARSRLTRSLTDSECVKYLHQPVCPAQD
jgi:hypothetical protein